MLGTRTPFSLATTNSATHNTNTEPFHTPRLSIVTGNNARTPTIHNAATQRRGVGNHTTKKNWNNKRKEHNSRNGNAGVPLAGRIF